MQGTALQVLQQAALELGLPKPTLGAVSQEATSVQLWALLNAAGNELCVYHDWQFLNKTAKIITVSGQATYDRPSDFNHQIDQTFWDKNNSRPVSGPVSSQGWQTLENAVISTGPFSRYRINGNKVEVTPTPETDGNEMNYCYISNGWVQSYLDPNRFMSILENDQDTILFDFWLIVKFLKLKMWEAKGLDTTTLGADFARTFGTLTGHDQGAPILNLSPRVAMPYISVYNVPEGNWKV